MDSPAIPLTRQNLAMLGGKDARLRGYYQDKDAVDTWRNDVFRDLRLDKVKRLGPEEHESAALANYHLMSGTILCIDEETFVDNGINDGYLFNPSGDNERPFRLKHNPFLSYLGELGHAGVDTQEELEHARQFLKYAQSANPKFLFRGFHAGSGGGEKGLNGWNDVVPHAFLDVMTHTSMWEIRADDLWEMITSHIQHYTSIRSPFSSWTHTLATALKFALNNPSSTIAVVDTTHESMVDQVWFSEELAAGGLTADSYTDEFLIFGLVLRPNYHCISVQRLMSTTRVWDIIDGSVDAFGTVRISSIERGAVEASRQLATALRPDGADLEDILILTATFVGVRAAKFIRFGRYLTYHDIHAFLYYIRDDLQELVMRPGARDTSLALQTMDTWFSQALDFEVQLLQAAENAIHVMLWGMRAAISSPLATANHGQVRDTQFPPGPAIPAKRLSVGSDEDDEDDHGKDSGK